MMGYYFLGLIFSLFNNNFWVNSLILKIKGLLRSGGLVGRVLFVFF